MNTINPNKFLLIIAMIVTVITMTGSASVAENSVDAANNVLVMESADRSAAAASSEVRGVLRIDLAQTSVSDVYAGGASAISNPLPSITKRSQSSQSGKKGDKDQPEKNNGSGKDDKPAKNENAAKDNDSGKDDKPSKNENAGNGGDADKDDNSGKNGGLTGNEDETGKNDDKTPPGQENDKTPPGQEKDNGKPEFVDFKPEIYITGDSAENSGAIEKVKVQSNGKLDNTGGEIQDLENDGDVTGGKVTGSVKNNGNMYGVTINGVVKNKGLIEDADLEDGTVVEGGILSGVINGNNVVIKNAVIDSEHVSHYIHIGNGSKVTEKND